MLTGHRLATFNGMTDKVDFVFLRSRRNGVGEKTSGNGDGIEGETANNNDDGCSTCTD